MYKRTIGLTPACIPRHLQSTNKKVTSRGIGIKVSEYCALCGCQLTPNDEEGICHLCKMSIIFNDDICPDIDDFAC